MLFDFRHRVDGGLYGGDVFVFEVLDGGVAFALNPSLQECDTLVERVSNGGPVEFDADCHNGLQ